MAKENTDDIENCRVATVEILRFAQSDSTEMSYC